LVDRLWAVFHLTEELAHWRDLRGPPPSDIAHLAGDIERAARALVGEWVDHMAHRRVNYPYLYSLASRLNPFDPSATPVVA